LNNNDVVLKEEHGSRRDGLQTVNSDVGSRRREIKAAASLFRGYNSYAALEARTAAQVLSGW
jgi:hypothetical protein